MVKKPVTNQHVKHHYAADLTHACIAFLVQINALLAQRCTISQEWAIWLHINAPADQSMHSTSRLLGVHTARRGLTGPSSTLSQARSANVGQT